MRTIPPTLLAQIVTSTTPDPWLVLYEIVVNDDNDTFRLVAEKTPVEWDGKVFSPYPITHGEIKADSQGTLPAFEITVSNITREVEALMDTNSGLRSRRATLYIVHKDHLDVPEPLATIQARTGQSGVSNAAATFRLAAPLLTQSPHPPSRYMRTRCRWVYGGPQCGYDRTRSGALPTCAKTLADCVAHGDDEEADGVPVLHPKRFGGQPGIARFG